MAVFSALFIMNANAQPDKDTIFNNVVVANSYLNRFYIGMSNPINFAVKGYCGEIIPQFDKMDGVPGDISKDSTGQYFVYIGTGANQGWQCKILLFGKEKDSSIKYLGSKMFWVTHLSHPVCYVDNKCGNFTIRKPELLICTRLSIRQIELFGHPEWPVESFTMEVEKTDGTIITKTTDSKYFTTEMKELFKQLTKGDFVIIKNVVLQNPYHSTIQGVSMTIDE